MTQVLNVVVVEWNDREDMENSVAPKALIIVYYIGTAECARLPVRCSEADTAPFALTRFPPLLTMSRYERVPCWNSYILPRNL
jgi:hypothetical protein